MPNSNVCLGLCFFDNQLYYAINDPGHPQRLRRLGSVDFNFDVAGTLFTQDSQHFPVIEQTIRQLKEQFDIKHVRMLSFPASECWTTLPKLVYDNAEEREAYINILMNGMERQQISPSWHSLSNQNYKFLLLRNRQDLQGLEKLMARFSTTELISEFEVGSRWIRQAHPGGSFMTVCGYSNCISVSSFILGKLRGATYLRYDDPKDLPYLWLQQTQELNWMQGLHEQIMVYGYNAYQIIELLQAFWDEAGKVIKMDTLQKMQVEADEATYGFSLEKAFPSVMLALTE